MQEAGAQAADRLLLTPRGIPTSLRPFFQEYTLEELDPQRDAFTVLERTLAWGNLPELQWLFKTYGVGRVREWVQQYGWYGLPRRRLKLWLCILGIRQYRQGARIWPH